MADDLLKHSQYWELLLHSGSSHKLTALSSIVCAHPTQSETRQAKIFGIKSGVFSRQEPSIQIQYEGACE